MGFLWEISHLLGVCVLSKHSCIVDGPSREELMQAFTEVYSESEGIVMFSIEDTQGSRTTYEKECVIISLSYDGGTPDGFSFVAFCKESKAKIKGHYNCKNKRGYFATQNEKIIGF